MKTEQTCRPVYFGGDKRQQTFLACQQEELLIQRCFLFHLSHVFQGQKFIRRGGVRALVQSCHYDGERVRPNTDVHPTRKRRPSRKKARYKRWHWTDPFFYCCCQAMRRSSSSSGGGLERRQEAKPLSLSVAVDVPSLLSKHLHPSVFCALKNLTLRVHNYTIACLSNSKWRLPADDTTRSSPWASLHAPCSRIAVLPGISLVLMLPTKRLLRMFPPPPALPFAGL